MERKATGSYPVQPTARLILSKIQEASDCFNIVSLHRDIAACEGLFARDQIIDVAILGQFNAGKSSFINSLIGQDILPVGVVPVTTVITRLHYDQEPKAIITGFDGTRTEAAIDEVTLALQQSHPVLRHIVIEPEA